VTVAYVCYVEVISTVHVTFLFNHAGITLGFDMTSYTFSEDIGDTSDNIRIVNQSNVLSEIDIPLELTINMATSTAEEGEPNPLPVQLWCFYLSHTCITIVKVCGMVKQLKCLFWTMFTTCTCVSLTHSHTMYLKFR